MRRLIVTIAIIASALSFGTSHALDLGSIIDSTIGGAKALGDAAKKITPGEEHYIGRTVAAKILSSFPLLNNQGLTDYVNKVGLTVAYHSDRPVTYGGYHFAVLNSDDVNAFACPGGFIFITKGLLKQIGNEDELASVLGHEIAHVSQQDGIKAIKKSRWTKLAFYAAGEVGKNYAPAEVTQLTQEFQGVVEEVTSKVVDKGYGRKDEKDADDLGLKFAMNAGYSPKAMADFIDKEMKSGYAGGKSGPFSSHPSPSQRLKLVNATIGSLSSPQTVSAVRTSRFKQELASIR